MKKMTQIEAVVQTLERLGGIATLGQLNQEVFKIENCEWKTKTPFASIRRIVQQDKKIFKIKPGLYALESRRKEIEKLGVVIETEKNRDSKELQDFNHAYYQGLLLTIGNMRKYKTFVPNQDINKLYATQKLGELRTLQELPNFSYENFIQRISTVDVIWFNERNMPHSLFEVEHSTDIQNSLLKFNDLTDFHTRMIIVADEVRKSEYEKKIKYSAFTDLVQNKRVKFLSYNELEKYYTMEIERQKFETVL